MNQDNFQFCFQPISLWGSIRENLSGLLTFNISVNGPNIFKEQWLLTISAVYMILFCWSLVRERVGMNIICQADTHLWLGSFIWPPVQYKICQSQSFDPFICPHEWLRGSCSLWHFLNADLNGFDEMPHTSSNQFGALKALSTILLKD